MWARAQVGIVCGLMHISLYVLATIMNVSACKWIWVVFQSTVPRMEFVEGMSNTSDNGVQGFLFCALKRRPVRYFAEFAAYPRG